MKIGKKTAVAIAALAAAAVAAEVYYFVSRKTVIIADGSRLSVYVNAATVGEALKKTGVRFGEQDIVEPAPAAPLKYPRVIKIVRVTDEIEISSAPLKSVVVARSILRGNLRPVLYKKIKAGRTVMKTRVVRHDGVEISREVVERRIEPRTDEFLHLLDPKGKFSVEHYDLSKCRKIKMVATAYYPGDPLAWRDGTVTYLGMKMQRGLVAVDPKVIPLRTRVFVPGYGYGYAADTGNAIKGNRIDLGVRDAEEEKSWMHKGVTVYILGRSKKF